MVDYSIEYFGWDHPGVDISVNRADPTGLHAVTREATAAANSAPSLESASSEGGFGSAIGSLLQQVNTHEKLTHFLQCHWYQIIIIFFLCRWILGRLWGSMMRLVRGCSAFLTDKERMELLNEMKGNAREHQQLKSNEFSAEDAAIRAQKDEKLRKQQQEAREERWRRRGRLLDNRVPPPPPPPSPPMLPRQRRSSLITTRQVSFTANTTGNTTAIPRTDDASQVSRTLTQPPPPVVPETQPFTSHDSVDINPFHLQNENEPHNNNNNIGEANEHVPPVVGWLQDQVVAADVEMEAIETKEDAQSTESSADADEQHHEDEEEEEGEERAVLVGFKRKRRSASPEKPHQQGLRESETPVTPTTAVKSRESVESSIAAKAPERTASQELQLLVDSDDLEFNREAGSVFLARNTSMLSRRTTSNNDKKKESSAKAGKTQNGDECAGNTSAAGSKTTAASGEEEDKLPKKRVKKSKQEE